MKTFLGIVKDLALLIARLALGTVLIIHGWTRYDDGLSKQVQILNDLKVPYPDVFAYGAILFEMVGGVLLIFGLATPLVGLVLLVEQIMIISYAKWKLGPQVLDGGWEYNLILAAFGLVFLGVGAGRAAVDNLFRRRPEDDGTRVIRDADPA